MEQILGFVYFVMVVGFYYLLFRYVIIPVGRFFVNNPDAQKTALDLIRRVFGK